jgi:hypothetical protein
MTLGDSVPSRGTKNTNPDIIVPDMTTSQGSSTFVPFNHPVSVNLSLQLTARSGKLSRSPIGMSALLSDDPGGSRAGGIRSSATR